MLRTLCTAVATLCLTLLAGELLMRVLPVSSATMTGYYGDPDLLVYPAGHSWTMSTGWDLRNAQTLHSNNLGFASDKDFVSDASALVLIGDSYVEANMLKQADRPAVQLQALLPAQRPVYGLGAPGSALLDYAQRVRYASQALESRDFVLWLEAGDARQSVCGSGNVHSRCLDAQTLAPRTERLPPPSTVKRWARHSALAQYVFGQLKLNVDQLVASLRPASAHHTTVSDAHADADARAAVQPGAPARLRSEAMVTAVVRNFFTEVGPYLHGRLVVAVDGRRTGQGAPLSLLDVERNLLISQLRAGGAEVIDLEPLYQAHAARSALSLEVGPYDHHLNPLGVHLVMAAVAQRLQSAPTK